MTTPRAGIGRITAAIVAIAAMLPYLTIKVLWLTGSSLGVTDPALMGTSTMLGMNAMTFGMDAIALVLALAFTTRWGMRLPAWLVLLPLWVGTGLLAVVMVTAPLGVLLEGVSVFDTGGPIETWVYLMVYTGFIGQGAGLLTAFALYARDRWPAAFTTPVRYGSASATKSFQLVVGWGALLVSALLGGTRLYWALGGAAGLPPEMAEALTAAGAAQGAIKGVLTVAAGVALVVMVRGLGRGPFRQPLAVAWLGSGAMFSWGLYAMIVMIAGNPLGGGVTGAADLVELFSLLTGLVMGMCGAFLLAERSAVRDVQPAQHPLEGEDRDRDRQAAHHGHR
ncbi:hypothetical protein [Nonomuraea sp. SBT364]|uniref:hypothetical protein n=1 Tax=Nonomuraea sp. SBT364 TaxID=1580530 RepID=UPI00066A37E1|nr:hypothetical protein [Nonomuraea sp. SBT364]